MSAKGCSPDNAAAEGFFGRLRSEPGVFILAGLRMVAVVAFGRDGGQAELRRESR